MAIWFCLYLVREISIVFKEASVKCQGILNSGGFVGIMGNLACYFVSYDIDAFCCFLQLEATVNDLGHQTTTPARVTLLVMPWPLELWGWWLCNSKTPHSDIIGSDCPTITLTILFLPVLEWIKEVLLSTNAWFTLTKLTSVRPLRNANCLTQSLLRLFQRCLRTKV